MTRVSYVIKTERGTPVHAYDNEQRAREALLKAQKRVTAKLRLVRITQTEEVI